MFEAIIRRLSTVGMRRGLNGNKPLLYLGILALGIRALRRLARGSPDEDVLYRTAIKAGDVFEIITKAPPK